LRLADFRGALSVAQQTATFAEAAEDPAGLLIADLLLSNCYHWSGDQAAARFYGERGIARAAESGTLIPSFLGFDPRTMAPITLARALWIQGFFDQARRLVKNAVDDEAEVHPASRCVTLAYGSYVFLWSGDFRSADDYVGRLIEHAARHSLEPYRAAGLGLKGALAIACGDFEAGIDLLRGALEILTAKRMNFLLTDHMAALAEGLFKAGQAEEALLTVNRAIARATDCGSTFGMAELLRIKGHILAVMPQHGRLAAMDCLTEALAVARAQSALALELRSTVALARLLAEDGRRDQARHDLALVYGRFTEGFETADLKIARQLMEELA
jgi:predicted ATPase